MSRWIILCSLALAGLAEATIWGIRSGPGWLLLVGAAAAASQFLRWRLERPGNGWGSWLWLAALGQAAAPCLYEAEVVHTLAPPLCLISTLLAVYYTVAVAQPLEALTHNSPVGGGSALRAAEMGYQHLPRFSASTRKGLTMAVPLLLLFGLLLMQADPAFEGFLTHWMGDWQSSLLRFLRCILWTWLAAAVWLQAQSRPAARPQDQPGAGDAASWTVALHTTNLLFLSFLACQARYLFAGRAPAGMSLAEYARHGFFELFMVTLLVIGLTVWVQGSVFQAENPGPCRLASQLMLLLTFGLVASSTQRMALYVQNFGLTLTRAYVLATLVGITATLVLCCWALGYGRGPGWLRSRLLLLGMLSLTGVGLTNVEAWVARVNLARPEVDLDYLRGLSSDIAPALAADQAPLLEAILRRQQKRDWREFTCSHKAASQQRNPKRI
ncbi:MAG: DUF4173 domain-containing protein [Vulcanimicrobiota bacterium]